MKRLKRLTIILLSLCFMPFMNAKADYFAYVPDVTNKLLHVYNTTRNIYVDGVTMFGSPRDVFVSYDGTKVYVSSVLQERVNESQIGIVRTDTNKIEAGGLITITGNEVRGLATTHDDKVLFVTHADGVTKIDNPGSLNTITNNYEVTYTGLTLTISNDDKYLFVVGTDGNNNDGISVIDIASFEEITDYYLGTAKGASEIVFNNNETDPQLYVALSNSDQVVAVKILEYDTPSEFSLEPFKVREFAKLDSNPIDLQLNKNNSELLVVLSYIKNILVDGEEIGVGTGDGNIVILDAADISSTTPPNYTPEIFLSNENSNPNFTPEGGRIHPLAVNIDKNGVIYVLKQIWSDTTGIYVSRLKDTTSLSTGVRTIKEDENYPSYNLGNKVSTLANGQFLGPNCDICPNGLEDTDPGDLERPAGISFFLLLSTCFMLLGFRRFSKP